MALNLGNIILRLRRLKRMSQEDLAEKAGIGVKTIRAIEHNTQEPRANTLASLAAALNVKPETFSIDIQSNSASSIYANCEQAVWPARLLVCETSALALYACARMLVGCLKTSDIRSLMLPTGRTAALLFESLLGDTTVDLSLFGQAHLFIDTETFGVSPTHPSSRQRFVRNSLLAGLKRRKISIRKENTHFFNGCLPGIDRLAQYDAMVQRYRPSAHLLAVSPDGEIIGYDPDEVLDITACDKDRCKVIHLQESGRRYIDPNQPSRAIITIGLGNLLEAEHIILPILHPSKKAILAKMLAGPIDNNCPVTMLRLHKGVTILTTSEIIQPIADGVDEVMISRDHVDERMREEGLL